LYLLGVLALAFTARAQFDQGEISGTIKDPSQAVVLAATVTATSAETGQTLSAVPDQNGAYRFTNLRVGSYEIAVQAPGFKSYKRTNVRVDAAARTTVDVVLEVGATTDSIEVTANLVMTTLDTAQIGRTIESTQITDLALNGRDPLNMAVLKAGVIGDQFNGFNPGWVEQSVSIAGGRKNGNAVTVDGVNMLRARGDATRDTNIGQLNVDAVSEVQILTSSYPAEYGRAMDGQVRFVTKGGTRDFHGTAWEFFRNSALDANSWVRNNSPKLSDNSRPSPFRFNQPGYSLGGPIVIPGKLNTDRKKLFFFVTQEFMWYRKDQTNTSTVPSAAMRTGDFSELLNASNPFFTKVRIVNDPTTGKPFTGNIIPPNLLSHNGTAILAAYPLPTPGFQQGTANWIETLANPITTRKDLFHVDYYTSKHRISFMGTHFSYEEDQPFEGTFGTGLDRANTRWHRPNKLAVASITSTLSPTRINDFSVSAAADRAQLDPYVGAVGDKLTRDQYGIDFPYIIPGSKVIPNRIPAAAIAGLFTLNGGGRPQNSSGPIYGWTDNFTWVARNNHTLKFGVFVEKATQKNNEQTGAQNGSFTFLDAGANNPLTTGLAIANAAMGNYDSYSEAGPRPYTLVTSWAVESYAQDTWKVAPNLTVEMGLRWSYRQPWHPKWNDLANFEAAFYDPANVAIVDPSQGFVVSGDPYNGIVLPGNGVPDSAKGRANAIYLPNYQRLFHNLPNGFVKAYHDAFAPRLGIAYRLSNKTGIRACGGVFHQRQMLQNMFSNPPNLVSVSTGFGKVDNPGGSVAHTFPFSVSALDLNYKYPTAYSYSLSIQHELPGGLVLDVAYVGKNSVNLLRTRNINQLPAGTLQAHPGVQTNALRPYLGLASINYTTTDGRSKYNSLQVSLDRRFHSGLGFGVSYTFSKARDNIGWLGAAAYAPYFVYAPFEWDRPHTLNVNAIYELPFMRNGAGLARTLLGGWQVSTVLFFRSGDPLSVLDSVDNAGTGQGNAPWNLVGSTAVTGPTGVGQPWFNPAAFAQPKAGTFGNAGLGIIRGPRFQSTDASLFKNLRLHERLTGQLRFEVFNFANHPLLSDPVTDPRSGFFGYVTQKVVTSTQANVSTNERQMQLGVKLIF
jgi:hypothetical protein